MGVCFMTQEKILRIAPNIKVNSRELRSNMTDAEQHLWRHLRMRQLNGLKFRRQHPCGNYILDFACIEMKLAIELDGSQHQQQIEYDKNRTEWLNSEGWKLLRFWNNEVLQTSENVLEAIDECCQK